MKQQQRRRITTLRGAPERVKKWWGRTGLEAALFRLVELGATWDDAHERASGSRGSAGTTAPAAPRPSSTAHSPA